MIIYQPFTMCIRPSIMFISRARPRNLSSDNTRLSSSSLLKHLSTSSRNMSAANPPKFPFARPQAWDPPAEYAQLRKDEPISRVELWDGSKPWLVVKHQDVVSVLTDNRLSKVRGYERKRRRGSYATISCSLPFTLSAMTTFYNCKYADTLKQRQRPGFPEMSAGGKEAAKNKPTFVDMDPPQHMQQRSMVDSLFNKDAATKLRPHIQQTVDSLLEKMLREGGNGPVDLVDKFGVPVPSYVS